MQHTILEFNDCLRFSFSQYSIVETREGGKLWIAEMHKRTWDSACGTGCLFNLARMWIMRGKIPEHETGGPLVY